MPKRIYEINELGHLVFGGCDTVELAKIYGTPLYVMDAAQIDAQMKECVRAMKDQFAAYKVFYASKAFCSKAVYKMAKKNGLHLDVVSAGELKMALESGMPGERIALHGNVKLYPELSMAIEHGCTINIDSVEEIADIQAIAAEKGKRVPVLVRVTPGVEAHTHKYIQTGIEDCKFGLGIDNGMAMEAIRTILSCPNLDFCGIHGHIGSQILEDEPYRPTGRNLAAFAMEVESKLGVQVKEINLGGGFGIMYTEDDTPLPKAQKGDVLAMFATGAYCYAMASNYNKLPIPTVVMVENGKHGVIVKGQTLEDMTRFEQIPAWLGEEYGD